MDSKNVFENSQAPFSEHLNEERLVSPDEQTRFSVPSDSDSGSTSRCAQDDVSLPADDAGTRHDPQGDDASLEDVHAVIAESSQEVLESSGEEFVGAVVPPGSEKAPSVGSQSGAGGLSFSDSESGTQGRVTASGAMASDRPGADVAQVKTPGGLISRATDETVAVASSSSDRMHGEGVPRTLKLNGSQATPSSSSVPVERQTSLTDEQGVESEVLARMKVSKAAAEGSRIRAEAAVQNQIAEERGFKSGQGNMQSAEERSGSQAKVRSLTELLSRQGITMESEARGMDPALGRVREINQTVAHEQAIRTMGGGTAPGSAVSSTGAGSGLAAAGPLEARTSVLSEVLSRSANESKVSERATMVTARSLNALASQRGGSLTIRLDPPSLGQVMIRMSVSDGVVQAELHASNAAGRVVMERGLETLRASLESRGLTVERLAVQAGASSSESQGTRSESNAQDQGQQQSEADEKEDGRQDAAGRESRGRDQGRGVRPGHDDPDQNQQDVSFTQIMSEDAA